MATAIHRGPLKFNVCTYACMYVRMFSCLNARTYVCMLVRACMYVCAYVCMVVLFAYLSGTDHNSGSYSKIPCFESKVYGSLSLMHARMMYACTCVCMYAYMYDLLQPITNQGGSCTCSRETNSRHLVQACIFYCLIGACLR